MGPRITRSPALEKITGNAQTPSWPGWRCSRCRSTGLDPQRLADHGPSAVVADEHSQHSQDARPGHRYRQGARIHSQAHRRDPASAGAGGCRPGWSAHAALAAFAGNAAGAHRRGCSGRAGAFTAVGLPLDTRYAFLASAILCVFCGAGSLAGRSLGGAIRAGAGG